MLPPNSCRVHESSDSSILVETLPTGNFLVKVQSGAVSIRVVVPREKVGFLFPAAEVA